MMFNFILVFTIVSVSFVGSHVVTTPEDYWKSVFPDTRMPKAIKELLDPQIYTDFDRFTKETTFSNSASENQPDTFRVVYSASKDQPDTFRVVYSAPKDEPDTFRVVYSAPKDEPDTFRVVYSAPKDQLDTFRVVYSAPKDQPDTFRVVYSASKEHPSKDHLKDDPNVALFFLENDLYQGKEIKIHLTKKDQKALFLPQKIADSIPFSSKNLTQVYNMFSVKPDSVEAKIMKQTLGLCERERMEGEEKHCATSLESMVDFSTATLGKKVKPITTEVINTKESSTALSKYKIKEARKLATNKAVVCHKLNYAYAVFYCHAIANTKAYAVSLVGENDTKVNAVAVCHIDTSKWDPQHVAFQVLKVKPGGVPVCHYLPEGQVVWVPRTTTASA